MIDLNQIKKHYASMSDEKLFQFAKAEKTGLTKDARTILIKEFEKRNLDRSIFELTQAEFDYDKEAHWFFALKEKRNGSSNEDIFSKLIARNITEDQATLIPRRLPENTINNKAFEDFIKEKCETSQFAWNVISALFIVGSALAIIYGITNAHFPIAFMGVFIMILTVSIWLKNPIYGGDFWFNTIKSSPENIVWIKPIIEKHTLWFVITLSKTYYFQILTRDNKNIAIKCDDDKTQKIFIEGIKKYVPHAHIGYSLDMFEMYERSPDDFINGLQYEDMYLPVCELE